MGLSAICFANRDKSPSEASRSDGGALREPQDFSPWWLTAGDLSQRTCELRKVPCESHRTSVRGGLPLRFALRLTCGSPDKKATFAGAHSSACGYAVRFALRIACGSSGKKATFAALTPPPAATLSVLSSGSPAVRRTERQRSLRSLLPLRLRTPVLMSQFGYFRTALLLVRLLS